MRTIKTVLLVALAALILAACRGATPSVGPPSAESPTFAREWVRRPVVAGSFYEADPGRLAAAVDGYLEGLAATEGRPIALIAPHAGYVYSGQVAAYAYAELRGRQYDAVILIGPNHRVRGFTGVAVYPKGAFETPLGLVPIEEELAGAILQADASFHDDPELHAHDHALEVQLPFLQRVLPGTPIVPILIGRPTVENCQALADALVKVLEGKNVLLIASSDLSHYPAYNDAIEIDGAILDAVGTMDVEVLRQTIAEQTALGIPNLATTCCGEGAIAVIMLVAPQLGADHVTVLHYANSGDVPIGDRTQVVGYGAVKFWTEE
jgi:AmmeMemoRadiSam system protein B